MSKPTTKRPPTAIAPTIAPIALPAVQSPAPFDAKVHPQVGRALARAGTPRAEVAAILGIDEPMLDAWCVAHPAFAQAMREGRAFADARVEDTLYRRATGYDYEESEVEQAPDGTKTITIKKKHVAGDVDACIFWMRAHGRQPPKR